MLVLLVVSWMGFESDPSLLVFGFHVFETVSRLVAVGRFDVAHDHVASRGGASAFAAFTAVWDESCLDWIVTHAVRARASGSSGDVQKFASQTASFGCLRPRVQ